MKSDAVVVSYAIPSEANPTLPKQENAPKPCTETDVYGQQSVVSHADSHHGHVKLLPLPSFTNPNTSSLTRLGTAALAQHCNAHRLSNSASSFFILSWRLAS